MADTKLTDLTEMTAAVATDVLYIVDDPGGTPANNKVTVDTLLSTEYGQIYLTGGGASQSLVADTWTKFTQFTLNGLSSANITTDQANDKITVGVAGIYSVTISMSFTGSSNVTFDTQIRWNGSEQNQIQFRRKLGTSADVGSASASGLIDATSAATDIEVYIKSVGAAGDYDAIEASLVIHKVAKT